MSVGLYVDPVPHYALNFRQTLEERKLSYQCKTKSNSWTIRNLNSSLSLSSLFFLSLASKGEPTHDKGVGAFQQSLAIEDFRLQL